MCFQDHTFHLYMPWDILWSLLTEWSNLVSTCYLKDQPFAFTIACPFLANLRDKSLLHF